MIDWRLRHRRHQEREPARYCVPVDTSYARALALDTWQFRPRAQAPPGHAMLGRLRLPSREAEPSRAVRTQAPPGHAMLGRLRLPSREVEPSRAVRAQAEPGQEVRGNPEEQPASSANE